MNNVGDVQTNKEISLKGRHLFVVEDNPQNRVIYQIMFMRSSALVVFDIWGKDTLLKLHSHPKLDLIILDLMLPNGISGYDVFNAIRQDGKFDSVPVVAVSATDPNTAIARCQTLGFDGFIPKPIDTDTFPKLITRIVSGEKIWLTQNIE